MEKFFPIGITYGATLPREERDNDLAEIADAGFNCIRISTCPHSSADLEYILNLAESCGLKVLVSLDYHSEHCIEAIPFDREVDKFFSAMTERLWRYNSIAAWIVKVPDPFDADFEESAIHAIKSIDPTRPVISESAGVPSKVSGLLGVSCLIDDLPPAALSTYWQKERYIGFNLRIAKSAAGATDVLAMPLQSSPSAGWIDFMPEDVAMFTWSALANGAKGLIYNCWDPCQTSARETSIKGIDGKIWPGLKRIAADIRKLTELPGILGGRTVMPSAAIMMPSSHKLPPPTSRLEGAYRLLADNYVSVAFISDLASAEGLSKYTAVYAPYLPNVTESLASAIIEYIMEGGAFIAEAPFAVMNEHGESYQTKPGAGLSEIFGCRVTDDKISGMRAVTTTSIAQGVFTYVGANLKFFIDGPSQEIEVQPGRSTILEFLDPRTHRSAGPAIIIGKIGKGKAVYIAGCLSSAYYGIEHLYIHELVSGVLDWFEIPRQVEVRGLTKGFENRFEVGVIEGIDSAGHRAAICINHSNATVHPTLVLKPGKSAKVRELFTNTEAQTRLSEDELSIMTHVPERDVRIYYEADGD